MTSRFSAAQHEAAHVVVGVALGLRLGSASARLWGDGNYRGYCWFPLPPKRCLMAECIMTAAGVAWERARDPRTPDVRGIARYDWKELRALLPSRHDAESCVRAAAAMLASRGRAHRLVTRALLDRDITAADITAICSVPHRAIRGTRRAMPR